jgi:nitroreductase
VDVAAAISKFRAVRAFADRPLEPDVLDRILDAGRRAPSSKNLQRWHFVACTDRAHLQQLAAVGPFAGHVAGAAAAVALVTPEAQEAWDAESIAFDLGQCAQNMMLAAFELGVGSVHATVYEEGLARELLGYPDGFRCRYLISLGYPAEPDALTRPLRKGGRKPLHEIVHRERW